MQAPKIAVGEETKKALDKIKIHHRETYEDILKRLLKMYKENVLHVKSNKKIFKNKK